jgi:hypothetical protein
MSKPTVATFANKAAIAKKVDIVVKLMVSHRVMSETTTWLGIFATAVASRP